MYNHILVPLENSQADEAILAHVLPLARTTGARVTLVHVADGFFARNQERFEESQEIREDRAYLAACRERLEAEGIAATALLACGEPSVQILAAAEREQCDLIAMATHGHTGLADLVFGSVAHEVRHRTSLPVLLIKAPARPRER